MAFKDDLKNDYIPLVERMIEKEKAHLNSLETRKNKFTNLNWFQRNLSLINYAGLAKQFEELVESNKNELKFLEGRLEHYKDYLENILDA